MTQWPPQPIYVDPRHVYVPQGYQHSPWHSQDPYYHLNSPPPPTNNPQRSSKYPSINPVLAEDTTLLRFDLKQKPSVSIIPSTYYTHRVTTAFARPTQRMRLISKVFPWTIDIESQSPITCGDIWEAMHFALQEPIVESEWGFIARDGKLREAVEAATKKRLAADPTADKRARRIDFLGDTTLFRGLEKDDDFAKQVLVPGGKGCSETWVIKLIA